MTMSETEMEMNAYVPDDDDQEDDDQDQNQDDTSSDDDSGASAIASASDDEADAHRNMLGDVMQKLSDNGIDVDELADKAGIDSSDVDALGHDDLATLTSYLAQHHPDLVQDAADRFPAAQGILGSITGGGGLSGIVGNLFNR